MEPSKEKLEADLALLEQAVQTLDQALREPLTDIVRDAVIQRFEYVFEAIEARNKTSHTYNVKLADEVFQVAWRFPPLVSEFIASIKKL